MSSDCVPPTHPGSATWHLPWSRLTKPNPTISHSLLSDMANDTQNAPCGSSRASPESPSAKAAHLLRRAGQLGRCRRRLACRRGVTPSPSPRPRSSARPLPPPPPPSPRRCRRRHRRPRGAAWFPYAARETSRRGGACEQRRPARRGGMAAHPLARWGWSTDGARGSPRHCCCCHRPG